MEFNAWDYASKFDNSGNRDTKGMQVTDETPARFDMSKRANVEFEQFCEVCIAKTDTIFLMILAIFGIRLLEVMFFVGLVGSAVVVLISFVEDFKELFGEE